jgi:hypothetical protein
VAGMRLRLCPRYYISLESMMKLYKIRASANDAPGKYSRAIVAAETEEQARRTHPDGESVVTEGLDILGTWVSVQEVRVEYLGEAKPGTQAGVILASYIGR